MRMSRMEPFEYVCELCDDNLQASPPKRGTFYSAIDNELNAAAGIVQKMQEFSFTSSQ